MPFEGQLKQKPSSLVFKGTKYSRVPKLQPCLWFHLFLSSIDCQASSGYSDLLVTFKLCVCGVHVCVSTFMCVSLPLCPAAAACALVVICHVIIFSSVLHIDYLSSGWKVDFCFSKLANCVCFFLLSYSGSILLLLYFYNTRSFDPAYLWLFPFSFS